MAEQQPSAAGSRVRSGREKLRLCRSPVAGRRSPVGWLPVAAVTAVAELAAAVLVPLFTTAGQSSGDPFGTVTTAPSAPGRFRASPKPREPGQRRIRPRSVAVATAAVRESTPSFV
ncbi:hypothetical protein GCM10027258_50260 [Amycolatopsis stemonae]